MRFDAGTRLLADARSKGPALRASTLTCAQADRWSPYTSRSPLQAQRFGASGRGRRSLRSSMTRNSSSGTRVSALVGKAVKAQLAASPPCDSSSARDVGSSSVKSVSSTGLCRALDAVRCQPGLSPGAGRVVWSAGAAASSSGSFAQVGAGKPSERKSGQPVLLLACWGGSTGRRVQQRAEKAGVAAALGRCPPRSSSRQRGVAERRTPVPDLPCSGGVGLACG